MGFFGAVGKAMTSNPFKPINKAVGKLPGMNKMAPPGAGRIGIGPTPNPSGGMGGKMATMGRPPQAMPQLPPMQPEQNYGAPAPPMEMSMGQPQPFMPQEPQVPIGEPLPQVGGGGGMMPIPQAPQMQPQKQSMFAQKKPQLSGKAARRGY